MVNNNKFAQRLKKVIEYYGESASSFAEKINVQRSSISHVLSGRNKPSLDFILKILSSYPDVDLYWLVNGKGNFPPSQKKIEFETPQVTSAKKNSATENPNSPIEELKNEIQTKGKRIEQIVIFYSDGSFKNFQN
ncbi:helix-turn-helix domain-containing protein [Seonamhaeicola marinus]|uniref:Helix-turn-helix transcriptional regulator n=1 Tax=Seonamhaeicola marinus TaxID=1912246 RepID=A0A5D0HKK6_9FLAO|nr:helix-turn-helix transcriptional regulator [Seonamhaeicola marinus]TYA71851.1 helix-turn-helix transcriptional regulator [Seonamhaeicola marinus]